MRLPRRDVIPLFALGAVGFGIYQPLWTIGLSQTTAADSALLIAATPMFTLLIAAAIGSDHLTANRVVGAPSRSWASASSSCRPRQAGFEGHLAGDVITLIAAAAVGVLRGVRRARPATPFAAADDDLGGARSGRS